MAYQKDYSEIALCQVEDVMALIDKNLKGDQHPLIIQLINAFSERAQGPMLCNRKFLKKKYEEYFDGGGYTVVVQAPPILIDDSLEVWDDYTRAFTDTGNKMVLWDQFAIPNNGESGMIKSLWGPFTSDYHNVKAVYNGGIVKVDNENSVFDVPDDLRSACAMQVSFWYKNRDNLGISSMTFAQGGATVFQPTKLLPEVLDTLLGRRHHHVQ